MPTSMTFQSASDALQLQKSDLRPNCPSRAPVPAALPTPFRRIDSRVPAWCHGPRNGSGGISSRAGPCIVTKELAMKAWLGGLALAGLVATGATAQDTKVAIGIAGWTGFAPLTLAKEAGIFKRSEEHT